MMVQPERINRCDREGVERGPESRPNCPEREERLLEGVREERWHEKVARQDREREGER